MLMRTDPFRELGPALPSRCSAPKAPSPARGDADGRLARRRHVRRRTRPAGRRARTRSTSTSNATSSPSRPNGRTGDDDTELIAAERPRGVFSRQLILGDTLDTEHVAASMTRVC